eukprot:6617363-Lingulodinium_polyedra.AAC.1
MSAFHPDLPQPELSLFVMLMCCSPTRVQKAHLPVVVHVVLFLISGDPLLVRMPAHAPVSAHVGSPP